jgi:hypothetical protein
MQTSRTNQQLPQRPATGPRRLASRKKDILQGKARPAAKALILNSAWVFSQK